MGNDWDKSIGIYKCLGGVRFVDCATADDIYKALKSGENALVLTGSTYVFSTPVNTCKMFYLSADHETPINFKTTKYLPALFIVTGGAGADFNRLNLDANGCNVGSFISADTSGSCNHSNITFDNCNIENLVASNFLLAPKCSISDKVKIDSCHFKNNICNLFSLDKETDNVGYYNVEQMEVTNCSFNNHKGSILNLYRGGKDESTMGPNLLFSNNKLETCTNDKELISLFGVQVSTITNNKFINCNNNSSKYLVSYKDNVRAAHLLKNNTFQNNSGTIKPDKYVVDKDLPQ